METIQSQRKNPEVEIRVHSYVPWAFESHSNGKSWESSWQVRDGMCRDNGASHLHILEAHAHNEIRGPVGQASNSNGSWARTLAEEFSYNEPWDGAGTNFKEGHKAKDGHDAQIGHLGHLILLRTREKEGKLDWSLRGSRNCRGRLGWIAGGLGLILDL